MKALMRMVLAGAMVMAAASAARAADSDAQRTETIKGSYRSAFARVAQDGEIKYWLGRRDWSTVEDLINLHKTYIQANPSVREEVIRNSYNWALSRPAQGPEVEHWKGRKDWSIGRDLIRFHIAYIRSNESVLKDVVMKAYQNVLKREAKPEEINKWRENVARYELSYTEIALALVYENLSTPRK